MGRILAIDVGTKRYGFALSDETHTIAQPLDSFDVSEGDIIHHIQQIVEKQNVEKIIIGIPKTLSNTESIQTKRVREVFEKLGKTFPNLAIEEVDERFTTKEVLKELEWHDQRSRSYRDIIDSLAAQKMLQSVLEQKPKNKE